jgi:F-type H+-transporting ATPase subunit a
MKPKTKFLIVAALALLAFVLGFVFLRGPTPHIVIAAEELFSVGPVKVTNTMVTSWVIVALIIVFVVLVTRRWTLVPSGRLQGLVEAGLEAFYNLVVSIAGEKNGRRFFPVVGTIFLYVLISNWLSLTPVFNVIGFQHEADHGVVMERTEIGPLDVAYVPLSNPGSLSGETIDEDDPEAHEKAEQAREEGKFVGELLPLFRGVNTDLNTPLALAIASAIAVEFWGVSTLGLFTYGKKFFAFGTLFRGITRFKPGLVFQGIIDAFVGLLELISETVRLVSFTFRLFGNMFAGEVVILMFTFLTPIMLTLAFYGLEIFVGLIQAFIFSMLTLVFAVMAVSHAEHEAHGAREGAEGAHGHEEGAREGLAPTG